MISLENAKRLKELGIEFEKPMYLSYLYDDTPYDVFIPKVLREDRLWWCPTLSELLEEVEKRGYRWELRHHDISKDYSFYVYEDKGAYEHVRIFETDTPEDAVALALISILEVE